MHLKEDTVSQACHASQLSKLMLVVVLGLRYISIGIATDA